MNPLRLIIGGALGVALYFWLMNKASAEIRHGFVDVETIGDPAISNADFYAQYGIDYNTEYGAPFDPGVYDIEDAQIIQQPVASTPAPDYSGVWERDDMDAGNIVQMDNGLTLPYITPPVRANDNLWAFLAAIRYAEGTADAGGYTRMFGGEQFSGFADHPRMLQTATFKGGKTVTSDAAGAYQFLSTTWDEAQRALGLPDFSPESQDIAAVWLIKRRGALNDVLSGNFRSAVMKLGYEWASLPGSPYGQPTQSMSTLENIYAQNGGGFA